MSHAGPSVDKTTPAGPSNPAPAPQPPATLTDDNLQNLQQLVIDTASEDDQDSTFGDNYSSYSTSLASSIFNYEYSNGRRYHAYRSGSYLLPNDEQEVDRLDMLHHIFLLCLGGKLYEAPISEPTRILDVGTGSGIWAIVVAEDNPQAEVLGTDLSPIQPSLVTPNLKFYIDDAEAEWVYPPHEHFDFIHIRGMAGAIKDWDRLIQQAYDNMVPGGWLEFQEPESWCHSDDDTVHRAVYLDRWQRLCNEASDRFGKQLRVSHTLLDRIKAAGFVDCHEKIVKVSLSNPPSGAAPAD
ncbi:S-adenosyl-L-methionine-dependent methyltransferase [Sporormia fimetaria CBS 119925]|uniref:S-adenosyl-L-methionine-dependent methyltransferase n=1 Tax=Sporormia fimetaria CBS 119925 TaxID=1340428 RepID=A0A6A6V044_9PLEO|nr:S-adenosyl-L-methionine-dependent methyltransferase [Sporormia fimetaria CBS 119925]